MKLDCRQVLVGALPERSVETMTGWFFSALPTAHGCFGYTPAGSRKSLPVLRLHSSAPKPSWEKFSRLGIRKKLLTAPSDPHPRTTRGQSLIPRPVKEPDPYRSVSGPRWGAWWDSPAPPPASSNFQTKAPPVPRSGTPPDPTRKRGSWDPRAGSTSLTPTRKKGEATRRLRGQWGVRRDNETWRRTNKEASAS